MQGKTWNTLLVDFSLDLLFVCIAHFLGNINIDKQTQYSNSNNSDQPVHVFHFLSIIDSA